MSLRGCEGKTNLEHHLEETRFRQAMPLNSVLNYLFSTPINLSKAWVAQVYKKFHPAYSESHLPPCTRQRKRKSNECGQNNVQQKEKNTGVLTDLEAEKDIYSSIFLPSPPHHPKSKSRSRAYSCMVALPCWVTKSDDDDYRPYYASWDVLQFNTEGPNGATVYLKYFTLIKGAII